jgi:RNA polymerase sigma-70 factor (ECF subfamily)
MTDSQFTVYYKKNEKALLSFAKRFTSNQADAQDLVQETAFKAFKGRNTFKSGTSFKSWAFTILRNVFITKYNKNKRRNLVSNHVEDMNFAIEKSFVSENEGEATLRMNEISASINRLSHKTRLPIQLHLEGFQYDEIAERLNIPVGTVKSRINYARTKLKESSELIELRRA